MILPVNVPGYAGTNGSRWWPEQTSRLSKRSALDLAVRDHANRPPAVAVERAALDTRAEADVRLELKCPRIVGEVGKHLPVRGEVWIVHRHRKVVE